MEITLEKNPRKRKDTSTRDVTRILLLFLSPTNDIHNDRNADKRIT